MIVVDASVLANAVADDTASGRTARTRLADAVDISSPDLVDVEVASVLRKRWLAGTLTARRFKLALVDLVDLPITRYPAAPMLLRAYELRSNVTPYDALYVALAEALACPLLTADARLARAPGARCDVRVIT